MNHAHVKGIPNARLLVSVNHCMGQDAKLMIYDISKKGRAKTVFSFEEVRGSNS